MFDFEREQWARSHNQLGHSLKNKKKYTSKTNNNNNNNTAQKLLGDFPALMRFIAVVWLSQHHVYLFFVLCCADCFCLL